MRSSLIADGGPRVPVRHVSHLRFRFLLLVLVVLVDGRFLVWRLSLVPQEEDPLVASLLGSFGQTLALSSTFVRTDRTDDRLVVQERMKRSHPTRQSGYTDSRPQA